ncbi:MAG: ABC transporter ATP-binding protein [Pseudomonadota bacterium]
MQSEDAPHVLTLGKLVKLAVEILGEEKDYFKLTIIYGVGISLLSLATPISVQMLINTVANTGLATPLIVLSLTLFALLLFSGYLNALRIHLMEIFGRRFYARLVSEITLRALYARNPFFSDQSKSDLFNRYFDIIIVQKNIPVLLVGGFTLILQAAVGFALVSLYHPLFFVFNLVFIMIIWAVWTIWGGAGVQTAAELSHKKHEAADWIEGLGASNGFFKSERHIAHALTNADAVTHNYIEAHRAHFRQYFSQTVSFFVIYAVASALLLGLGGWLVIQAQLSVGQLVAAELVLSAAFFGVSQLGTYLNYFYELCGSIDELSLFFGVEQDEPTSSNRLQIHDPSLRFANVEGQARGRHARLDFDIKGGSVVMATAANHGVQRLMTDILKRHEDPRSGYVAFGGSDIRSMELHALRQEIIVIDRTTILETTIREFLHLNAADPSPECILNALKTVGLEPVVADLEDGLDTKVARTGWPLSVTETMQLKLAAAILAQPRVLILNQLYDLMAENCIKNAINALRQDPSLTVIYFSNRRQDLGFDSFLYMGRERQCVFDAYEEYSTMAHSSTPRLISEVKGI